MAPDSSGNPNPQLAPNAADQDIDKEVAEALGDMSIEDLMAQAVSRPGAGPTLDPSRPVRGGRPSAGRPRAEGEAAPAGPSTRRGRIVSIRERSVFIDLGGKSQGVVPLEQFDALPEGPDGQKHAVEIGQEHDFVYNNYDAREGLVHLSLKGAVAHGGLESLREGDVVEGEVTGVNKGGLELKVNNSRAFMPAGQVDIRFNADLAAFMGQRLKAQVIKLDRADRNIVLSRRILLEADQAVNKEKTWNELAVGQIREGTVSSVQPYGAFVDIGGIDGLLHVSAMSHTRVSDPTKVVKPGQKIQVMVVGLDREKDRVSLGLKQLTKDPWDAVAQDFPVGTTVTGIVKKTADFGAFVELAPGVEGLVHISQLSTKRIARASEVVKEGQEVQAKVLNVDLEKKRISLSMADVERDLRGTAHETPAPQEAATHGSGPSHRPTGNQPVGTTRAPEPARPAKPERKSPLKGGL